MGFIIKIIFFILLFFCSSCTSIIYQPDRYLHGDPHVFEIEFNEFFIPSFDGTKLLAWDLKSKTKNPENLVLFFHGNAENLSSHFYNLSWMTEKSTDVLIFDYRGYGLSEGSPNPKGVMEDGLKFLQTAYTKYKAGGYKKFVIYTQSLGGAIAMRALQEVDWRDEITLLVLDSTFRSPREVASFKTNGMLGFLISSEYTADPSLSRLSMPILFIHSKLDPVINIKFGEMLFQKVPSTKKDFWQLEQAGHGDVFFLDKGKYREEFINYLNKLK
jgi:alpha-beta hydrolase superfamily lysophospholipase